MQSKTSPPKGFTLLELLIVIAILAILAAIAIFVLNPAETLRESRDTQRVSDLATLKTAIGLYITKTTSPDLTNDATDNNRCVQGGSPTLFYSYPSDGSGGLITDTSFDGGNFSTSSQATSSYYALPDGTGWIRIKFSGLTGGSPISDVPVDPTNSIATLSAVTSTDLVYRFACAKNDVTFEINAQLESTSVGARKTKDGGNNSLLYEVGTNLAIIGSAADL